MDNLLFPNISLLLGCLSASVHGMNNIGTELTTNHELFANAFYESTHHCLSSELLPVIEYLKAGRVFHNKQRFSNESVLEQDSNLLFQLTSKETVIKCMKFSKYNLLSL